MTILRNTALATLALLAAGCVTPDQALSAAVQTPAFAGAMTSTQSSLLALPPPREKLAVTVYNFLDQTGRFEPTEGVQSLSKAISQGSTSILVKALQDAGNRTWFTVLERENLDNLLKERQIIREMRKQYLGEENINPDALPPMLFAGIILEGGVIGYDTNTVTGGAGARFLGIGAHTSYREDTVTVYLRAVSVKTGEVITTVVASKKIASIGVSANAFRFVSYKELLEAETGITTNEPDLLALRQAVEKAVEMLVVEGAELGVWSFGDKSAGDALMEKHRKENGGVFAARAPAGKTPVTAQSAQVAPAAKATKGS